MPARNEAWVIGFSARAVLKWANALVVLNHASTDATAETVAKVADEYPGRVAMLTENSPDWNEADIRQRLLNHGRKLGGTHFALVDADEVLTANFIPLIGSIASSLRPGMCLRLPWFCLWRSLDQYRDDDSPFGRAYAPCLFANSSDLSFRPNADGYQIHTRAPAGCAIHDLMPRDGGLMHLQHAVWRRVVAKQALYRMTELLRWDKPVKEINRRYGPTTDEIGMWLSDVPPLWWQGYDRSGIDLAAEPWQEAEVRRLLEQYRSERFEGLEL